MSSRALYRIVAILCFLGTAACSDDRESMHGDGDEPSTLPTGGSNAAVGGGGMNGGGAAGAAGAAGVSNGLQAGTGPLGGMAGAAGGAEGGVTEAPPEGSSCKRMGTSCDADCQASCGSDPACVDLCCYDESFEGVVCNGGCRASRDCKFEHEGDAACSNAVPIPTGTDRCSLSATVRGRDYHVSVVIEGGTGFEMASCRRTWLGAPEGELLSGGGGPCTTTPCPSACDEANRFWMSCCGR